MTLLPVQPFQETLNAGYCGPASLKMVMSYFGVEKTEEEIAEMCGRDAKLGTDETALKRAAEEYGFKVEIQNEANFEDIQTWLGKEVPVIVNWFTRGRADYNDLHVPDGHYSVVVALDDDRIYLQDPEIGKLRTISREDFLRVWFDFRGERITSWNDMIIRQLVAVYPNRI